MKRNADYAYAYLRDPADGLFYRNWRLWTIGETQCREWQRLTGQPCRLEPDEAERSREAPDLKRSVGERPLVKTLLANAGTVRLFWLLARAER